MIDKAYLQDLLAILRLHGVSHIKMQGLELSFGDKEKSQSISTTGLNPELPTDGTSLDHIAETLKKQEEAMPPDLRADALMDQDKILNWSSPDQSPDEPPLPLTGEQEL